MYHKINRPGEGYSAHKTATTRAKRITTAAVAAVAIEQQRHLLSMLILLNF